MQCFGNFDLGGVLVRLTATEVSLGFRMLGFRMSGGGIMPVRLGLGGDLNCEESTRSSGFD